MTLINICFRLTALTKAIFSDSDSFWLFISITIFFSLQIFKKQTLLDDNFRKTSCGSQGEQQTEVKVIILKQLKL